MKKLQPRKKFKMFMVLSGLILTWFLLTVVQILINDESLTRIDRRYRTHEFSDINFQPILQGETRRFEIEASHNNFGSVKIHFITFDRKNSDILIFRIKEKDAHDWYYENTYDTYAFTTLPFYPFGFPLIANAKGKKYIIELQSQHGIENNSVALSKSTTILAASYIFDKSKFISDHSYFLSYLWNKSINSLQNNYLTFTTTVYMYPFLFYIFYMYILVDNKQINNRSLIKNPFALLLGVTVLYDIVFVHEKFDLLFFFICVLWTFILFYFKRGSRDSYISALILLLFAPLLQLFGQDFMLEKAAAWAFLALVVGIIINIYEINTSKKIHR